MFNAAMIFMLCILNKYSIKKCIVLYYHIAFTRQKCNNFLFIKYPSSYNK